ncbi:MAG: hypothetical protein R3A47_03130 [Polyangiales bacterium]
MLSEFKPLLLVLLVVIASGCGESLDVTRVLGFRGTLGEEMYKVVCNRMAAEAHPDDKTGAQSKDVCEGKAEPDPNDAPRYVALTKNRDRLVKAFDDTFPESLETDLNKLLIKIVPLYDPPAEVLPNQTRSVADLLVELLSDVDTLDALERLGARDGYRPLAVDIGQVRSMFEYPRFVPFANAVLNAIADDGNAGAEWKALMEAVSLEMATATPDPVDKVTTLDVSRGLLFSQNSKFGTGNPTFIARRDRRGMAIPREIGGAMPFADLDDDGQADIDSLGRFVGNNGQPLNIGEPFTVFDEGNKTRDSFGRLQLGGETVYESIDVDQTLLAGLAREIIPLLGESDTAVLDFAFGLDGLLGPSAPRTEMFGQTPLSFTGYATEESPLFDVLHGAGNFLGDPVTPEVLELLEILLRDHPQELIGVINAGLFGDLLGETKYADAALNPRQEFWDEMNWFAKKLAEQPPLLEAMLRGLADPRIRRLGTVLAEMARNRDMLEFDPTNVNRPLTDTWFVDPVDRSAPNTHDNESLLQQAFYAIYDITNAKLCNKADAHMIVDLNDIVNLGFDVAPLDLPLSLLGAGAECSVLEIDNGAKFYGEAVLGRAHIVLKNPILNGLADFLAGANNALCGFGFCGVIPTIDDMFERGSGIDGLTTHPTPQALDRLLFGPPTAFLTGLTDPVLTRQGDVITEFHPNVTLSWEREYFFCGDELVRASDDCSPGVTKEMSSFFEVFTPIVEAFHNNDEEIDGLYLFGELARVFTQHWPDETNDRTQGTDPNAKHFARRDRVVKYEPIFSDLVADCSWVPDGAGGKRCDPAYAGQMIKRLHELALVLDDITLSSGKPAFEVVRDAVIKMVDPAKNVGYVGRRGQTTTMTNDNTHVVPLTPLYEIFDGLNAIDASLEQLEPERKARWRSARSKTVDTFLSTRLVSDKAEFWNKRTTPMLLSLVHFLQGRYADHEERGDLDQWKLSLATRFETSVRSATGSAMLRLLEALQSDPDTRYELTELVRYLIDEKSDPLTFNTSLASVADVLQTMEDDTNLIPLFTRFSDALAVGAPDAPSTGAMPSASNAVLERSFDLIREVDVLDDKKVLAEVFKNLVQQPDGPNTRTPLEVIIDVIAEVNRAAPNTGTPLEADDYVRVFDITTSFLTDGDRGLERVYKVIQNRELD